MEPLVRLESESLVQRALLELAPLAQRVRRVQPGSTGQQALPELSVFQERRAQPESRAVMVLLGLLA